MNKKWKKPYKPKRRAAASTIKSKGLKQAVKKVVKETIKRSIETKTVVAPFNPGGTANTIYLAYGALSGIQYLCQDVFRMPQGAQDTTQIGSANRIGDTITPKGMLMDFYFSIPNFYSVGAAAFFIPYVKLRITVFAQAFGSPLLSTPLLYDSNILATNTSTLQPINWDEGYVKSVLYDQVFIIRNNLSVQAAGSGTFPNLPQSGNVLHFKKYLPLSKKIKFCDNNTSSPNSTTEPIYICIAAEVDDSNSGVVPSGTVILHSTGYVRGWFKDA